MSTDFSAYSSLLDDRSRVEQQRENASRPAVCAMRYRTTGAGGILTQAIPFDVVFLEAPFATFGFVLEKRPDDRHYALPSISAGVLRWQTQTAPNGQPIYVGAFLAINVDAPPLFNPRTDGSNLSALVAARNAEANPVKRASYQPLIDEAQEAVYLLANPPSATIEHHIRFEGLALKTRLGL